VRKIESAEVRKFVSSKEVRSYESKSFISALTSFHAFALLRLVCRSVNAGQE